MLPSVIRGPGGEGMAVGLRIGQPWIKLPLCNSGKLIYFVNISVAFSLRLSRDPVA
jgi:hypothetical protein